MSAKSKVRGYQVEIQIRDKLLKVGVPCERVPLSGSIGGKYSGDLVIPSIEYPIFICESKARRNASGFKTIEKWLGGKHLLFVKRNRADPLVVMQFDVFLNLISDYIEKYKKE